jgi:hypothetical protein
VIRGELRVGKELTLFQERLRHWFYSYLIVGTFCFAILYLTLWELCMIAWRSFRQKYLQDPYDLEDLPSDFDLQSHDFAYYYPQPENGEPNTFDDFPDVMPSAQGNVETVRESLSGDEGEDIRQEEPRTRIGRDFSSNYDDNGQWEDLNIDSSPCYDDDSSFSTAHQGRNYY